MLNWSYRHLRFMPIMNQGHAGLGDRPTCVPRSDFARSLPWFREKRVRPANGLGRQSLLSSLHRV